MKGTQFFIIRASLFSLSNCINILSVLKSCVLKYLYISLSDLGLVSKCVSLSYFARKISFLAKRLRSLIAVNLSSFLVGQKLSPSCSILTISCDSGNSLRLIMFNSAPSSLELESFSAYLVSGFACFPETLNLKNVSCLS